MRITDYSLAEWTKSYGEKPSKHSEVDIICTHNAGLFSCFTIRLIFLMIYFNTKKDLAKIDSSKQFTFFKNTATRDLSLELFSEFQRPGFGGIRKRDFIPTFEDGEISFTDYSKLNFNDIELFKQLYFTPSKMIQSKVLQIEQKYQLDYPNLCAVFFRGNDKKRETAEIPYEAYISKANEVLAENPDIKFLLLPDETEFKIAFMEAFPNNTILMEETRHMRKKDSAIMYELPAADKPEHAFQFFSEVLIASKCNFVISHSGNGSLFCAIYRGNTNNFYQYLNGKWV